MQKTLFTFLSLIVFTLSYAQDDKDSPKNTSAKNAFTESLTSSENTMTVSAKHIIIQDRLDLEADSAQFDSEQKVLTAYGTKKFVFKGRLIIDKETGISRFYLNDDNETEAIIK
jgi:hypothetical protein